MTPSAAANPNALPPARTIAFAWSTSVPGRQRSISRVAGADPRTSTPTTAPASQRTTVTPVSASRSPACPATMPGTSQTELLVGRTLVLLPDFSEQALKTAGQLIRLALVHVFPQESVRLLACFLHLLWVVHELAERILRLPGQLFAIGHSGPT